MGETHNQIAIHLTQIVKKDFELLVFIPDNTEITFETVRY